MEDFLSKNISKICFILFMTAWLYLWFGPKPTGCFLIIAALIQLRPEKKEK